MPWCYYRLYGYPNKEACDIPPCDGIGDIPNADGNDASEDGADVPGPSDEEDSSMFMKIRCAMRVLIQNIPNDIYTV